MTDVCHLVNTSVLTRPDSQRPSAKDVSPHPKSTFESPSSINPVTEIKHQTYQQTKFKMWLSGVLSGVLSGSPA